MTPYIINDSTKNDVLFPHDKGTGLDLSLRDEDEGYGAVANRFPASLLIPRSEWQARIKELDETKSRLSDLVRAFGIKPLDQGRTNYCWVNGPTQCMQILRALQGQQLVKLSPASAGAVIKNFRNVGGWGKEALQYISDVGLNTVDEWPANAIYRRYHTTENTARKAAHRATEWWELQPRNLDEMISALLRRIPLAGGYNWWGHEITILDAVWLDGTVATGIYNSWGEQWGTGGYGILQGSRMMADDLVGPAVAVAS